MNYLAHAYLSFGNERILVGNMISDHVKGIKKFEYDATVQKGIMLHRMIDEFTDKHDATRMAKAFYKPAVGPYSGAFVDVMYDHYLAVDNNEFRPAGLNEFARETYLSLDKFTGVFPEKFGRMYPYMKQQNWLSNYSTLDGAKKSFEGLTRRTAYLQSSEPAYEVFLAHYNELQQCYAAFFPDIKNFARQNLELLLNAN